MDLSFLQKAAAAVKILKGHFNIWNVYKGYF